MQNISRGSHKIRIRWLSQAEPAAPSKSKKKASLDQNNAEVKSNKYYNQLRLAGFNIMNNANDKANGFYFLSILCNYITITSPNSLRSFFKNLRFS